MLSSPENFIGSMIFGLIGMMAFLWGKRKAELRPLTIGLLLMGYPYFVTDTWLMYGIGLLLTVVLFVWKEE